MSTSFPNSNGSVPPYNPQANGSFNQYGQGGPPGAFPGMDPYHNMYNPPANGYGAQPAGPPAAKAQQSQQFPGAGAGAKLPAYDGNPMQNGYMGYPPHQQRPNGQVAQNGPPPNYNTQNPHMPHNPYAPVPDPYRMYPGMQSATTPTAQTPTSQPGSTPTAPNNSFAAQPGGPAAQPGSNQYPAQQQLPAHLHGGPPYQGMPPPPSNAPLQHYQPSGYSNGTAAPSRGSTGQSLPSLQPSKQAKQEETRPNNLPTGASNSQYPPNPYGTGNSQNVFDPYHAGPNGYPGFGAQGPSGSSSTPGANGGNMTPGATGHFGYNPGLYSNPGPNNASSANTSGQNTPGLRTPVTNPYGTPGTSQAPFGNNDHSGNPASGNFPTNTSERATPGAQSGPGTPHSVGSGTPKQQLTPQSGMHMTPPPHYNQNPMASPNHAPNGSTPQKYPNSSPMGASLPPLNGQYPTMTHNLQSPVTTPTEPTFKEPAIPIRHSPMQSPQHQTPAGAPPAYNAPSSSSKLPDITAPQPPPRAPSPTFAVPTLPAAKPKTSPQKKRGDEPDPPSPDTPFTTVTHYELPPAMPEMRGAFSKTNPPLDKYYTRKRPPLRYPYPEGCNAHTAPATEPNTFGFIEGSKYYTKNGARNLTCQPTGPPVLNRSQSMHNTMVSPGFAAPTPPTGGRQPAKKARSASDASEPTFNMPLQPGRQQGRQADPRQMQQMQMQQYQQQMQMQKMHQQNQMVAHQQHLARMGQVPNMPSTSTASGIPPGPLGSQLPPLAPPALQRAESMPQLPSQQQPAMGGTMPPHMGGMPPPPMNGAPTEEQTANNNTGHRALPNNTNGLPPLTLGNSGPVGRQSHEYPPFAPSTSNPSQEQCAGCHNFIMPGSATLCCMYHDCKNVYHQECTRLSSNAFNHFNGAAQVRWVCPKCETQVRPMQMQHA